MTSTSTTASSFLTTGTTNGSAGRIMKSKSHTDMTVASSVSTSSRTSSVDSSKSGLFHFHMPRSIRSLSRGSVSSVRPLAAGPAGLTSTSPASAVAFSASPDLPSSVSAHQPERPYGHGHRKVLQKTHRRMSSSHELHSRRGSTGSDVYSRVSRASTTLSGGSSSSNALDWKTQPVESHAALDCLELLPAKHPNRIGYMVTTADFIVLFKSKSDAFSAAPQLADAAADNGATAKPHPSLLAPADPMHVIPVHAVISVFRSDNGRPPFGIDIWWRLPYPAIATSSAQLLFRTVRDRETSLDVVASMVKAKTHDQPLDTSRVCYEVEECIRKVVEAEEPTMLNSMPEIFPVVHRNASDRVKTKSEEKAKKGQPEGLSSCYLVVGIHLCFFLEISRASAIQSTALGVRYQTCGLVTLESFCADWSSRDERFSMQFRDPFKTPVGLELSSRHYRRIILTLTKADKFLKPAWPTPWQMQEIFHVTGFPTPQHIVAGEDFGGFQRTLTAFCAAYRCDPVDWEINWRTAHAPEFRVLPSRTGHAYTDLQLLAVLRALRFNDYFKSLSFCDVNLSSLLDKYDSPQRSNVAYLSRSGETIPSELPSVLHQEFHALAFASGKIRQMDFTNCLPADHRSTPGSHSVQFLLPILNLLAAGLTRCNRLFLRGCALGDSDIDSLAKDAVGLEALDVANCGLSDQSMKTLFQALSQSAWTLTMLDVSQNFGRVPAALFQQFLESVGSLRQLNVSGSLTGTFEGELLPFEVLDRLENLEELDLSNFKLDDTSLDALEKFVANLSARQASLQNGGYAYSLRRLVLSNCGITGYRAGRIFSAMSGLYDVHLHLSSNPLEVGIENFVAALESCWGGRFGLHMNMVEFEDEENYIQLVNALATNHYIDYLSLVGTAPNPTTDDTCSASTVAALARFFAENQSVRYLDLSGYCGKLDDGQLGKGFGRALQGLAQNKTLTHLRVRNQNLHDNAGTLGSVVQANTALLYLDCGDNGFTATSMRYVAKSMELNTTLLEYPLPRDELDRIVDHCLKEMPLPPSPPRQTGLKHRKKPTVDFGLERQKTLLREEIEAAAAEIITYTSRNIANVQQETGCIVDLDEASDTCEEMPYRLILDEDVFNSPADGTSPNWDLPATPKVPENKNQNALDGNFLEKAFYSEPSLSSILEKFTSHDGTEYVICNEA
ncbi:leucine rich repeat domain containing protein [Niveomyces insectorum RCEF 264]|uniref:Leucine rich repeat domain containing protein n=1 Tax=Niveomyces insectorum RCEF 264 TaxID=1081102 RepID=A0A162J5Y0_9HYPO|nr:leucine rich repeat domain containing protein [Niveomyces insectorum RCEF 264]